jgi:hypothetical protein
VVTTLCLSVNPPLIALNQLLDFYDTQEGGYGIECDLEAIFFFNSVAATITKWRTLKILRWI